MSAGDEESVLRDNLHVPALSPEALARIRRATEAEWRAQVGSPRRHWIPRAAAAAVALVALSAVWQFWMRSADIPEPMGSLVRTEGAGVIKVQPLWRDVAVTVGGDLRAGSDYHVRAASLLALRGGGNVRVAPGSAFEVLTANSIRLDSGELYVDIPPGQHADSSFVAVTSAGEFRHVGTQFALAVADGATRLRVREGRVEWHAPDGNSMVPAGTEITVDSNHRVSRGEFASDGEGWAWTETVAPDIDIENRPLTDFLDWVSRETGRKVVYADDTTQHQVEQIRTHGNVHGLPPMQALKAVMASTSLRFDLSAGAIRVSFAGDIPLPRT